MLRWQMNDKLKGFIRVWYPSHLNVLSHGVRMSQLGTAATVWPAVPAIDDDYCGAIGGIQIRRGNQTTRRKPAKVPLCQPQIPRGLTRARNRVAAVGRWRLTA
jgi:hypothetical protein